MKPDLPPRPDTPDQIENSDLEVEVPELKGQLQAQHEGHGHWPYDRGCNECVQARGRTPACRVKDKYERPPCLAADYIFLLQGDIGRFWYSSWCILEWWEWWCVGVTKKGTRSQLHLS